MKMYEKLGIDPTTKEGIIRILDFDCCAFPKEFRMCEKNVDFICAECAANYFSSEYKEREIDWTKVPKDTPVLVCEESSLDKQRRYFAEYKDGQFYVYQDGKTSWSTKLPPLWWRHCELAFPEQAKKEWYK